MELQNLLITFFFLCKHRSFNLSVFGAYLHAYVIFRLGIGLVIKNCKHVTSQCSLALETLEEHFETWHYSVTGFYSICLPMRVIKDTIYHNLFDNQSLF